MNESLSRALHVFQNVVWNGGAVGRDVALLRLYDRIVHGRH
ncbi:hypothetical protein [Prolixibacter bellariivorans]|nr:hypothetical protein [Prolixibacter bellariivorans]